MIQWIVSSSLLVMVMIGLRYLLRGRVKPILQYGLWALVLARLLLPFQFGSTPISIENSVEKAPLVQQMELADKVEHFEYHIDGSATGYYTFEPALDHEPNSGLNNEPVPQEFTHQQADQIIRLRTVKEYAVWAWVAGMVIMGVVFLASNLIFALKLRRSRILLEKGKLPVYVSGAVETPCLFGLFRPTIYLTPAVAEEERHRAYAIAHETTHYRHGDFLWSVLRCVCLVVHWYNPLVWWAAVLSRADGEIACDEATVAALGESQRADYGRLLIDLTCRKTTDMLRTATTMTGSAKGLKERIKMIVKRPKMAIYTLIAVILVASVAVGCTFTGAGKTTDPTDDPAQETTGMTDPTGATDPTGTTDPVEVDHLQDIVGTPLTEDELAYFTELFTSKGNGEQNMNYWYNVLLACEFSRPVDINPSRLFQNGFWPYPELNEADEAFLSTFWWYTPNGGDILKLFPSRMEEVLNTYLGVSLSQINQYYLENMIYFADGDCYFGGGGGAISAIDFEMVDGKREEDGTIWLLARKKVKEYNKYVTDWERVVCLKPQEENSAAPYWVESCKWVTYLGKPYPPTKDTAEYVVFMYTGTPVSIKDTVLSENMKENCLYAYNVEKGSYGAVVEWPVHSFDVGGGYVYFINRGQTQIIRTPIASMRYGERQLQVVYASGNKLKGVSYAGNNKLQVEEDGTTVLYDMTTGVPLRLPTVEQLSGTHNLQGKYFLLRYRASSEIQDAFYVGKPYSTAGMEENHLYAIDDGVIYPISGGPVLRYSGWDKDWDNDQVYFVREDDPNKVWRTDRHGQNLTLVYESSYGNITFLNYYSGDRLAMIEKDNRIVLYEMNTGKLTVLMEAYFINQFSYDAEEMSIFWEGKLNESDPEMPADWYLGDYRYYYYLKNGTYKMLDGKYNWVTVTPADQ